MINSYIILVSARNNNPVPASIDSSLFQAGVSLVDSPGVGESPFLNEMVQNYLSQAFGFIYIINSSNAGGIQPERVHYIFCQIILLTLS